MGQRYLVVVDMQHDFVDGALGTPEAQAIVARVAAQAQTFDGIVVFTKDTHYSDYLQTLEGKNLPVEHCLHGTPGWELMPELQAIRDERNSFVFEKTTFASLDLAMWLAEENVAEPIESIELIGLCTDICVISNALLIKGWIPEVPLKVDASLCAGVTPDGHKAALATLRSCQVEVINDPAQ
ncbi:MAG: cysteine hydrolase [Collinsella sp.]|nr:cysteine hydrolase [Collinsella sp.]